MSRLLLLLTTTFLMFNASAKNCSYYNSGKVEFLKIDSRKFPNEQLVLAIEVDSNCAIKYNPKVNYYWSAKKNNQCDDPAKAIKSLARPSQINHLSPNEYDIKINALYTATRRLKTPIDSIVKLKTYKSKGRCNVQTVMKVGNKSMKVTRLYINKASAKLSLSGLSPVFKSGSISGIVNKKSVTISFK